MSEDETTEEINADLLILSTRLLQLITQESDGVEKLRVNLPNVKPTYLMKKCKSRDIQEKKALIPTLSYIVENKSSNGSLVNCFLDRLIPDAAASTYEHLDAGIPDKFFSSDGLQLLYTNDMVKVWEVIARVFQENIMQNPDDNEEGESAWFFKFNSLNCLLGKKEKEWESMGRSGLPPAHEHIKTLSELEDKSLLLNYITGLIEKSISVEWDLAKLPDVKEQPKFQQYSSSSSSGGESNSPSSSSTSGNDSYARLIASMDASFCTALSFLPILIAEHPITLSKIVARIGTVILFGEISAAYISKFLSITSGVMPSQLLAGVCLWNSYLACRGRTSWKEAGKNMMEGILTSAVTWGWTYAVAWFGLGTFSSVGLLLGGGLVIGVGVHYLQWALFDMPKDEALKKAYGTLKLGTNASMEDVRREYRRLSRKFHPDHLRQYGATEAEILLGREEFQAVQDALQFIIKTRADEQKEGEREGWLQNIFRMFKNVVRQKKTMQFEKLLPPQPSN